MLKNILFLLACIVLVGLSWLAFQVFGQYTFIIMIVITIIGLIYKSGKPKFGNK